VRNQFVILFLESHPIYVVGKPILEQVEETKINLIWGKQLDEKRMKKVEDLVVFLLFFKKWTKKMKNLDDEDES
jgi:predicted transcriptional regulator